MAAIVALFLLTRVAGMSAQDRARPTVKAGVLSGPLQIDGVLSEAVWATAPLIDRLTMSEPTEGAPPPGSTRVRVLASAIRSAGDLFVIYNHNVRDIQQRWLLDSNQLLVKFQYAFQF